MHQPSVSFIHLVGARKGDDASGIRDVKRYLHQIGYLNDLKHAVNKMVDNLFNDSIEHAVLAYQEFFKLNKTGILDHDTISMMSKPRCGCPDIFRTAKKDISNDFFKRHYLLRPDKKHQTTNLLIYEFRNVSKRYRFGIIQAFANWEPYLPLRFFNTIDNKRLEPDNIIQFFSEAQYDFDGSMGHLARANLGEGSMLHFDADENWQVGAVPGAIDIIFVATHEIGHLLGLDHSDNESAIMYPYLPYGEVTKIGDDDIAGIKALYYDSS